MRDKGPKVVIRHPLHSGVMFFLFFFILLMSPFFVAGALSEPREGQNPILLLSAVIGGLVFGVLGFYYCIVACRMGVVLRNRGVIEIREGLRRVTTIRAEEVSRVVMGKHANGSPFLATCPTIVFSESGDSAEIVPHAFYTPFGLGYQMIRNRAKIVSFWLDVPFEDGDCCG